MADCSKTEQFFAEWKRACTSNEGTCWTCQLKHFCMGAFNHNISPKEYMHPVIIGEVQQWSDAHPAPKPKTYADVFFEKFPKASKSYLTQKDYESGLAFPSAKRCHIYGIGSGCCMNEECSSKMQARCWNEPYEEDNK